MEWYERVCKKNSKEKELRDARDTLRVMREIDSSIPPGERSFPGILEQEEKIKRLTKEYETI